MNGKKIQQRREQLNLSQTELAHRLKCNRTYLSKVENNQVNPSIAFLSRIANELKCTTGYFFD